MARNNSIYIESLLYFIVYPEKKRSDHFVSVISAYKMVILEPPSKLLYITNPIQIGTP